MYDQAQFEEALQRQLRLEDEASTLGVERFKTRLRKAAEGGRGSSAGAARKLLVEGLEPLEAAMKHHVDSQAGRRGPKTEAFKWINLLGADVASYLTLRIVLDELSKPKVHNLRLVAFRVSQHILDELRYRRLKTEAPGLFHYRMRRFQTSSYAHMSRSLTAALSYSEVNVGDLQMTQRQRLLVGCQLIGLLIEATGLVETANEHFHARRKVKEAIRLRPTPETQAWMAKRNAVMANLSPVNLPMVVPPLPWTPECRGGYRYALRGRHPLIRTHYMGGKQDEQDPHMPAVYSALNRIQETAWRINGDVLSLIEQLHSFQRDVAGVPAGELPPLPPKPADIDTNPLALSAWKKAAHAHRNEQHKYRGRVMEFARVLRIARRMQGEQAIWFPYNLDFRGRVYPVVDYLSPQGSDLQKSLLTFAEGKPLGQTGAFWLALHGANCLDVTPEGQKVSRMTRQERVQWIEDHTAEILAAASDPLGCQWWAEAGEPLQFFAFCVEWAQMHAHGRRESYVCALPVAQDGSCNGLQHFAALLLDSIGGRAVNVVANCRPADVYTTVAECAMTQLQAAKDAIGRLWISTGLIDRKLAKRPTMTFGYGSRRFGFSKQIQEYIHDNGHAHLFVSVGEDGKEDNQLAAASQRMAGEIWDALGGIVVKAVEGMAWMQKAARVIAKQGKVVAWTVPGTGFRVEQAYYSMEGKKVETVLAGRLIAPRFQVRTGVALHRQVNGVSPNIIHSLDAAALMLTVNAAAAEGIDSFGMIHDSYATVPGDAALLAQVTRRAFFGLYTRHDVIADLYEQFKAQAGDEEVPEPPAKGDLDLSEVLASEYFFC
jgi:DNA-directed RNA polymerase